MNNITQLLQRVEAGDQAAREPLLQAIYGELRKLAKHSKRGENADAMQTTEVIHEAYLRLMGSVEPQQWDSRGHFFTAAAITMRRILVDAARKRGASKRGGDLRRVDLDIAEPPVAEIREDLLALDEALTRLATVDSEAYELVHLRYFAGLTVAEAADAMGISKRGAERLWSYARAWLQTELRAG